MLASEFALVLLSCACLLLPHPHLQPCYHASVFYHSPICSTMMRVMLQISCRACRTLFVTSCKGSFHLGAEYCFIDGASDRKAATRSREIRREVIRNRSCSDASVCPEVLMWMQRQRHNMHLTIDIFMCMGPLASSSHG